MKASHFIFATCQVGAEPALKKEISGGNPQLRFAYSRPGFVTFKGESELKADFKLNSVLARAYGLSFGKVEGAQRVVERARELRSVAGRAIRLHVWERDRYLPGEEPKDWSYRIWKEKAKSLILAASTGTGDLFLKDEEAQAGEWVFDVVGVEEDEWWLGAHIHSDEHSRFAGGRPELVLPPESPSRAYLKIEEVLLWSGARLKQGDIALEVGSAPGGACYSLLRRGVSVIGVDPGAMDPVVRAFSRPVLPARASTTRNAGPWFKHFQIGIADLPIEEIREPVQWVLLDMNVVPNIALSSVERVIRDPRIQKSLLGVFLTLKLNRWILVEDVPKMLERVKKCGLFGVRAAQLSTHKQEIAVVGFTPRGKSERF